ncbi:MAG: hypothetical protein AAFU54_04605 [Chloroflexota bacterium]
MGGAFNEDEAIDAIDTLTVNNSGTISSNDGRAIDANDDATITNSGTVSSVEDNAIDIDDDGTVANSGNITSTNATGIDADENAVITNSGNITGNVAIDTGDDATVTNSGTVSGTGGTAMILRDGNDTVTNEGGTINGDVLLGDGDDTVTSINGTINDVVDGGNGEDSLIVTGEESCGAGSTFSGGGEGSFEGYSWKDVETVSINISAGGSGCGGGDADPRLNPHPDQIAIYCAAFGDAGIEVYDIDASVNGQFAFKALRSEITVAIVQATTSSTDVVVESDGFQNATLTATADGHLRFTTASGYIFTLPGNTCS